MRTIKPITSTGHGLLTVHLCILYLIIISDCSNHDKCHRKCCIDALLSRRRLDKIGSSHHTHKTSFVNVDKRAKFTGCNYRLQVGIATCFAAGLNFVIQCLPVTIKDKCSAYNNVDLLGAVRHGSFNLSQTLLQRSLTSCLKTRTILVTISIQYHFWTHCDKTKTKSKSIYLASLLDLLVDSDPSISPLP